MRLKNKELRRTYLPLVGSGQDRRHLAEKFLRFEHRHALWFILTATQANELSQCLQTSPHKHKQIRIFHSAGEKTFCPELVCKHKGSFGVGSQLVELTFASVDPVMAFNTTGVMTSLPCSDFFPIVCVTVSPPLPLGADRRSIDRRAFRAPPGALRCPLWSPGDEVADKHTGQQDICSTSACINTPPLRRGGQQERHALRGRAAADGKVHLCGGEASALPMRPFCERVHINNLLEMTLRGFWLGPRFLLRVVVTGKPPAARPWCCVRSCARG